MAKTKITTAKITYKISLEQLENLNTKMKDLTKLDKSIFIKINKKEIIIYSLVGKGSNINSFKSHKQNIKDTFNVIKDELDDELLYKILDGKKFTNSLSMFIKYMTSQNITDDVDFQLTYSPESFICEKLSIKNKKSKDETPGEKPSNDENIDIDQLDDLMDIDLTNYNFILTENDFKYIKTKSGIEKEQDVLYLNIKDKKLSIGENRWELEITEIDRPDEIITFPKKYFNCINFEIDSSMKIYVADTYLLIIGDTSNLLISIELSV